MPKYAVSLGSLSRKVMLEAENAQQAMNNCLAMMETQSIAMIPRVDKKDTYWFSRNVTNSGDEVVVKDTEAARKMLSSVRSDVLDVFWFVDLQQESRNNLRKIKK